MDYIEWLRKEYNPRMAHVDDIGEWGELKPLDFIVIEDMGDLKKAAEKKGTRWKKTDSPNVEQYVDFTFVSCMYNGDEYEGSCVAVTPYGMKNDMPHYEFKWALTTLFDEEGFADRFYEVFEDGGDC